MSEEKKPLDAEHWRKQAIWQNQRKAVWKTRCYVAWLTVGALVMCVGSYWLGTFKPPVPIITGTPAPMEHSPNYVLASIRIGGSSATVFAKGEFAAALGAKHAFGGWKIGDQGDADNVRGEKFKVTLEALDADSDLALLTLPAKYAVGVANIPTALPSYTTEKMAVGFPDTVGPNVKTLAREVQTAKLGAADVWNCHVDSGRYWFGDSGGGMFLVTGNDGALAGVISCGDERQGDKMVRMYCVPHARVLAFTKKHLKPKCGNGFCTPKAQAPGGWLKPNVPLDVPPPADDDGPAPLPAPGPEDKPLAKAEKAIDPNPHRPFPDDLSSIRRRVGAIEALQAEGKDIATLKREYAELKAEIDTLKPGDPAPNVPQPGSPPDLSGVQKQIDDLKKQIAGMPRPSPGSPGTTGQAGPQGEQGPPGKDADPAVLADLQTKLAEAQTKLTLLMQGVTVQVLDAKGNVSDQDTYPPGKPIKLQNAVTPISISQKAKTTNGG